MTSKNTFVIILGMDTKIVISKAVEVAGSQTELARMLGISQAAVSKLARGQTKKISGELAVRLERVFGGDVSRADIRPDLFRD